MSKISSMKSSCIERSFYKYTLVSLLLFQDIKIEHNEENMKLIIY